MSARLWLAYCTRGLFVIVAFVLFTGGNSMLSFVSVIVDMFGCVAVVGCTVGFAVITVLVIDVCVFAVVRFIVATVGGGHGLSAILWLA